jgi:hypothetical protein
LCVPRPHSDLTLSSFQATFDDYDEIPINNFGIDLLKGMGWKEGQNIGRNPKSGFVYHLA